MNDALESLFKTDYMPHGHCYWWQPDILWLNVISDSLIALAYFTIPITLYYFVKRRPELEFKGIFVLFSAFILLCGITHLVSIFVIWNGAYGIHGLFKLATAIVSCITAYKLFVSIPDALKIPTPGQMKLAIDATNKEKIERIQVENELRLKHALTESSTTHKSIIDALPVGLHVFKISNDDLIFIDYNLTAEKILGIDHKALLNLNIEQAFPDTKGNKTIEHFKNIARNGGAWSDKTAHYNDGKVSGFFSLRCFRSKPNTLVVLFEDVTQQQIAEQEMEYKDKFISTAFNSAITGVYIYNFESAEIDYINDTYTLLTGYTQDDLHLMGKGNLVSMVHKEDQDKLYAHARNVFKSHDTTIRFQTEHRLKHKKGHYIWVLSQDVVLEKDESGKVTKFMGSFLDISEIKNMQHRLVKLKDEAETANQIKSDFLANMSHEVRTPMNAILGLTNLVLGMDLGDKQRAYLGRVEAASKSLLNVLNDILDFSKMEAGKLVIKHEPFDLLQVIDTAIGLHMILAQEKSLTLKTNIAPNVKTFYIGDGLRITQILNNLIGNALKFTDEGHITLSVNIQEKDGLELICFEVQDTGIGISKESIQKLFDSFNQGDNSAIRNYGGTGLGLTISQTLAQLMQGDIKVESELGEGSKFTMCLPLELAHSLDIQTMPKQASQGNLLEQSLISNHQQKNSLENSFSGCTALLVEDNETNRIVAQELLAILGITTMDAHNGEQAIRAFEQGKFDVVLMDLHMPIIDGYSAVKTIRKIETGARTPILAMSAAVMSDVVDKVKAVGMDGHIPKPVGIYELFIELEKWLKPKEPKSVKNIHNLDKLNTSRADEILMMLSDLPDFDIVNALARMADNVDIYKKLLLSFYHEHQQSADLFAQAFNTSNNFELQRLAHTLKGAAGTIGAITLQRIALDMEIQVDQAKPSTIEGLCAELNNVLNTLTPIIKKLKTKPVANFAPKQNMSKEQCRTCIEKLIDELNNGQFLSELELKSQHKDLVDCISTEDFDALVLHIEHLEYAKAIDLLNLNLK